MIVVGGALVAVSVYVWILSRPGVARWLYRDGGRTGSRGS